MKEENALLTLTLKDGKTVKLSMATDSCPTFRTNGVYYNYKTDSKFHANAFFDCFDQIPFVM